MDRLFELLEENTGELGNFSIVYNDHKFCYCKTIEQIKDFYKPMSKEDVAEWEQENINIDWHQPIIQIHWYKDCPVGSYSIIGNSIKDLTNKVMEIIEAEKKWIS